MKPAVESHSGHLRLQVSSSQGSSTQHLIIAAYTFVSSIPYVKRQPQERQFPLSHGSTEFWQNAMRS